MKRILNALIAMLLAVAPLSAVAASPSPSPLPTLSPALDKVLLAPPSGYVAIASTSSPKTGHFTAHDWADQFDAKAAEAERVLGEDGFVDGYNLEWASQATRHVLNEFVLAFKGGRGASHWLTYFKAALAAGPLYQHPDTIAGIPAYFGLHETQSSIYGQAYLDGFVFVKGNDVIGVAYISLQDDNLKLATSQAQSQYAAAPASTIPPAQWPESVDATPSTVAAAPTGSGGSLVGVFPYALFGAAALVAILLGLTLLLVRVRRTQSAAGTAAAPTMPATVAAPGTAVAPVALPLQMSADGNFWYDGERWVDVTQEAPPFAQRSPDGAHWWDGYNWRPVPVAQAPASGR